MKTALVTGASGAIGRAIAEKFLNDGYFVVGGYNKNADGLLPLKNKFKDNFFPFKADLNNSSDIAALYGFCEKNFGHTDALILNAGKDLYKLLTDTTEEEWDEIFSVNVKSAFLLAKYCLPEMIRRQKGKILFISSVWGKAGASMETAYSASKAAMIGLTKALAKEVAPSNINVNCVCPGVIDSKMNARFNADEMRELIDSTPLKRLGTPEEVADLCYFLCSENAAFITGQAISIDGGFGS
ncbi:MAG: SDR family oxidoreductase [Clostridia bacterium]|nr:SDR family oxidoreductase [Clostridia bacterium]